MAFILSQTEVDVLLPAGPRTVPGQPGSSEPPAGREPPDWKTSTLERLETLFGSLHPDSL